MFHSSICFPESTALRAAGLDVGRAGRITKALNTLYVERRINGMCLRICRRGIVLDWKVGTHDISGHEPFSSNTLVRLFSMSKQMTAALMFQLFEEGLWRFDDPVAHFLPELANLKIGATGLVPMRQATLRDLMLHQAGFAYGISGTASNDVFERQYAEARILDFNENLETLLARLAKLPLAEEPGTPRYSISHDLLGLIAQRITGQPFASLMTERLFTPLGMVDSGFGIVPSKASRLAALHTLDADGRYALPDVSRFSALQWVVSPSPALHSGGAGVISTLGDVTRFLAEITHANSILSPAVLKLMGAATTTRSTQRSGAVMTPGWWTRVVDPSSTGSCASEGTLFANGAGGSFTWIDRARELSVLGLLTVTGWAPGDRTTHIFDPLVYQALTDL